MKYIIGILFLIIGFSGIPADARTVYVAQTSNTWNQWLHSPSEQGQTFFTGKYQNSIYSIWVKLSADPNNNGCNKSGSISMTLYNADQILGTPIGDPIATTTIDHEAINCEPTDVEFLFNVSSTPNKAYSFVLTNDTGDANFFFGSTLTNTYPYGTWFYKYLYSWTTQANYDMYFIVADTASTFASTYYPDTVEGYEGIMNNPMTNWVASWILPSTSTIQAILEETPDLLKTKIPFGYFEDLKSEFEDVTISTSSIQLAMTIPYDNDTKDFDMPIFDSENSVVADFASRLRPFIIAGLWFGFAVYLFNRITTINI